MCAQCFPKQGGERPTCTSQYTPCYEANQNLQVGSFALLPCSINLLEPVQILQPEVVLRATHTCCDPACRCTPTPAAPGRHISGRAAALQRRLQRLAALQG